jgi:hypothetical protein
MSVHTLQGCALGCTYNHFNSFRYIALLLFLLLHITLGRGVSLKAIRTR